MSEMEVMDRDELRKRVAEALVWRGLAHDGHMAIAGADAVLAALEPELRRLAELEREDRLRYERQKQWVSGIGR